MSLINRGVTRLTDATFEAHPIPTPEMKRPVRRRVLKTVAVDE